MKSVLQLQLAHLMVKQAFPGRLLSRATNASGTSKAFQAMKPGGAPGGLGTNSSLSLARQPSWVPRSQKPVSVTQAAQTPKRPQVPQDVHSIGEPQAKLNTPKRKLPWGIRFNRFVRNWGL